jgi:3',5'-cyclic AMP phosphodiesterase CpdA
VTLRIAHVSDLHFGESDHATAAILAADIRAAAPDAIAFSGDLTHRAKSHEFAEGLDFLRSLGPTLLAVPGNHDIPRFNLRARFLDPRGRWLAAGGTSGEVLDLPGVRLIAVDSVSRAQWHLDWSAGALPGHRLALLEEKLAGAGDARVVVVCHHPLLHAPWAWARSLPRGAHAAIALLRRHKVAGLLCGHLHRPEVRPLWPEGGVQVIAPTGMSPRMSGGANGWNLVEVGNRTLTVTTRLWTGGKWVARATLASTPVPIA